MTRHHRSQTRTLSWLVVLAGFQPIRVASWAVVVPATTLRRSRSRGRAAAAMPPPLAGATHHSMIPDDVASETEPVAALPLWQLALAGAAATLMTDIIMHPVDTVKTLQQADATGWGDAATTTTTGAGLAATVAALYQQWGLAGFYRGFLTYGAADGLGGAAKFAVWETWKQRYCSGSDAEMMKLDTTGPRLPQWVLLWIGAGLAFVASSVFIVPGELLKNRLQVGLYPGLEDAVLSIYHSSGLSGFFDGYDAVLYRDVPYTMLELGLYEQFKSVLDRLRAPDVPPRPWEPVIAAAASGGLTALATTPIDVIKTKLMVDHYDGGVWDCALQTVAQHGVGGLFAGVVARVGWILPFTALYLPTFDFLKDRLQQRHEAYISRRDPSWKQQEDRL